MGVFFVVKSLVPLFYCILSVLQLNTSVNVATSITRTRTNGNVFARFILIKLDSINSYHFPFKTRTVLLVKATAGGAVCL